MFEETRKIFNHLPSSTKDTISVLMNALSNHLYPALNLLNDELTTKSPEKLISQFKSETSGSIADIDLFSLCNNQIFKCCNILVEIFKKESQMSCVLLESRSWVIDRINWCLEKLCRLCYENKYLVNTDIITNPTTSSENLELKESIEHLADVDICCGDTFISRVDDTLDLLDIFSKLFSADCASNTKLNEEVYENGKWTNECSHRLFGLHKIVRELIFAAMSICQNCLTLDQKIVNARCQVVLRQSKQFIYEIMSDTTFLVEDTDEMNINKIKIKENIHYATVKLFNDILKDAIYNLEASINRAVLGLVLVCLVKPCNTLLKLNGDIMKKENNVLLNDKKEQLAETEMKSVLVKEFDILNERLVQIGLFAISCSADKMRVSMLRSCLASLEALEPYLIPSLLSASNDIHSQILVKHWIDEVKALRTLVFLIVDPVAFIEIVMEQYQTKLNDFKREDIPDWTSAQSFIELGDSILDYITAYLEHEPRAISGHETLILLSANLKKVIKECRVVSDLFLVKHKQNCKDINREQKVNAERVIKRFKLMYTILARISKEIIGDKSILVDEDIPENELKETIDNVTWIKTKITTDKKSIHKTELSKGVFKLFDVFKSNNSEKNIHKADAAPIKNSIKQNHPEVSIKNYASNKTFSRSSISRTVRKNQKRALAEQNKLSIFHELNNGEMANPGSRYNPCISASNFNLNNMNEEFFLANISTDVDNVNVDDEKNIDCNDITGAQFGSLLSSGNDQTRRRSFFYGDRLNSRRYRDLSLRKKLLINQTEYNNVLCPKPVSHEEKLINQSNSITAFPSMKDNLNSTFDLHVTDILEQLTGLSDTISLMRIDCVDDEVKSSFSKCTPLTSKIGNDIDESKNILTLKINEDQKSSPKKVWNIKIHSDKENIPLNPALEMVTVKNDDVICQSSCSVNCDIDVSFGSNIHTPERLNDLHKLEQKLTDLKHFWKS